MILERVVLRRIQAKWKIYLYVAQHMHLLSLTVPVSAPRLKGSGICYSKCEMGIK